MFRPFIFITFILLNAIQVISSTFVDNTLDVEPESDEFYSSEHSGSQIGDKIWVLELNDEGLDTLILRKANEEDEEDFEFYTEPLIENYNRQHSLVVKKDAAKPAKAEDLDKKTPVIKPDVSKEDIFKYLNKFAMYSKTDSDGYLSDSHENDDPGIALYFKGRFTSLIVKQGIRQWHYFISPPSILPSWFYEDLSSNTSDGTITMPNEVTVKFYPALYRLIQALLRYPV